MKKIFTLKLSLILCSTLALLTNTAYSQGSGHALNFDGNDYVDFGTNNLGYTSELSVSAWVRTTSTAYRIVCAKYSGPGDAGFVFWSWGGTFGISGRDGSGTFRSCYSPTTTGYDDGEWHHITGVVENDVWRIYIDGNLDFTLNTGNTSTNLDIASTLRIGQYTGASGSSPFIGTIDEVQIWNRALSQTEIRENMCQKLVGTEPNLVAYYRMDEGMDNSCTGGEDVCDLSSNNNHGTKF